MSNILPPGDASDVLMPMPVFEADTLSSEPHRDRQALAGVIEEGRIAGVVEAPLADEESRPDPSQAEARKRLDPIVAEPLDETRLPDEIAFDEVAT